MNLVNFVPIRFAIGRAMIANGQDFPVNIGRYAYCLLTGLIPFCAAFYQT